MHNSNDTMTTHIHSIAKKEKHKADVGLSPVTTNKERERQRETVSAISFWSAT